MAVKLCQEQPVHLAAPVLEPSVLSLVLQALPAHSVLQAQVAVWRLTRLAVWAE